MKENKKPHLDEEALLRLLRSHKRFMVELVIRLAWQAGLTRAQIHALTWEQVSLEDAEIRFPTHTVPIHPDLLETLNDRRKRPSSKKSEYVVLTDGFHTHPSNVHIARTVGKALDEEETLKEVTLKDLRDDYVIRALEEHGKEYALKVSHLSMSTLRQNYGQYVPRSRETVIEEHPSKSTEIDETQLMNFLAAEGTSPAAMALWFIWKQGMTLEESVSLTWEQVDFKKNIICLADRESEMHSVVAQLLKEIHDSREEGANPHVLLTPRSKVAFAYGRLSVVVRTVLVKKGLGSLCLLSLSNLGRMKTDEEKILAYLEEHGCITRNQVEDLLETTNTTAYNTLVRLMNKGRVVRVGGRYYLEGTVVPPEQHCQVVCDYLKGEGPSAVGDIATVLKIEKRACAHILRKMVENGIITMCGQLYSLPDTDI